MYKYENKNKNKNENKYWASGFKKYELVKVVALKSDHYTPSEFLGAEGMVIGFHKYSSEYNIEVCFFDKDLQVLAMDEGIDYFDASELDWL